MLLESFALPPANTSSSAKRRQPSCVLSGVLSPHIALASAEMPHAVQALGDSYIGKHLDDSGANRCWHLSNTALSKPLIDHQSCRLAASPVIDSLLSSNLFYRSEKLHLPSTRAELHLAAWHAGNICICRGASKDTGRDAASRCCRGREATTAAAGSGGPVRSGPLKAAGHRAAAAVLGFTSETLAVLVLGCLSVGKVRVGPSYRAGCCAANKK